MVERKRVKSIQLRVNEEVHKKLKEIKGDRTWEEFLIEPLIREEVRED